MIVYYDIPILKVFCGFDYVVVKFFIFLVSPRHHNLLPTHCCGCDHNCAITALPTEMTQL